MEKKKKLKKRQIVLLLFLLVCLIGVIVALQVRQSRQRQDYETEMMLLEKKEQEERKQEERKQEEEEQKRFQITNIEILAEPVMESETHQLLEAAEEWKEEKGLGGRTAEIIQLHVPDYAPTSTEFYIQYEDGSLVRLTWHAREQIVTADDSPYTEKELLDEVWKGNAPDKRDVSVEGDKK